MLKISCLLGLLMMGSVCFGGGNDPLPENSVNEIHHEDVSSERLDALLSPLSSLAADFTQTVRDLDGYELQSLEGEMVVARPGKIYWRSKAPFEQLLVSDAETLWLYDQDLEQVTVRPFEADISRTPAILFIGKVENLDEKYAISAAESGSGEIFTLVPLDPSALYQKVILSFENAVPSSMILWDTLGQKTEVALNNIQINQPVESSLFIFTVPDGVDVLYDQ